MKKLIFILLLIILATQVYALNDTITLYAGTNQPIQTNITITLDLGCDMVIEELDVSTRLNYQYPTVTSYITEQTKTINFITSERAYFYADNETVISKFKLYNTCNDIVYNYTIFTNVVEEQTLSESEEYFITQVNGNYVLNYTQNLLPVNGKLEFRVRGVFNHTLNISCDNWLTCPNSSIFNENNYTAFFVSYAIPYNASIGKFEKEVNLSAFGVDKKSIITFNILEPDIIFEEFVLDDSCFIDINSNEKAIRFDCYIDYKAFSVEQLRDLYSKLRQAESEQCVENITEHIYVGNVEEEVIDQYKDCVTTKSIISDDLNTCQGNNNDKDNQLQILNTKLTVCNKKLINNESTCLSTIFSTSVRMKEESEEDLRLMEEETKRLKKNIWDGFFTVIILLIIVAAGVIFIIKSKGRVFG